MNMTSGNWQANFKQIMLLSVQILTLEIHKVHLWKKWGIPVVWWLKCWTEES